MLFPPPKWPRIFLSILAAVLLSSRDGLAAVPQHLQPIAERLQRAVDTGEIASISVGVAKDGKFVWLEAFGWADRQSEKSATTDTRYAVASITKPITATAVMTLVDRGLIDLRRPANDYLGEAKISGRASSAEGATVERIFQHRAGLAEHNEYYFAERGEHRPPLDELIRRYAFVAYPVNERYSYSNLGYGVLERIIERVSGRSFPEYLRSAVFQPLGMVRSSVGPVRGETAVHYLDMRTPLPFHDFSSHGSGYVFSTAADLLRFGMFHLKEPSSPRAVMKPAMIDAMRRVRRTTGRAGGRYGTDWWCGLGLCGRDESAFGYAWFGHDGGSPGVSTRMKIVPSERLVVVALSNSRQQLTYDIVDEIIDVYLPEWRQPRRSDPALQPSNAPERFAPVDALLGAWTGRVRAGDDDIDVSLLVQPDGDIHVTIGDQLTTLLSSSRFENGLLTGEFAGRLPLRDIRRDVAYNLYLKMALDGDKLVGAMSAGAAAPRYEFWLPAPVSLQRSVTKAPALNPD